MSDINFLSNNNKKEEAPAVPKKPEVEWSAPAKQAQAATGASFAFLPFKKKPALEETKAAPAVDSGKINQSRQEILRLIKYHESLKPPADKNKNFLSALGDKIKKPPSHKDVLIDYQRVFNQEKAKKNQTGRIFNSAPAAPAKAELEKREPPPAVLSRSSWFSNFKELFKPKKKIASAFGVVELKAAQPFLKKPEVRPAPKIEAPIIAPRPARLASEALWARPEEKKEAREVIKPKEIKLPEPELNYRQEERGHVLETNLISEEIITFFNWQEKIIPLAAAILAPLVAAAAIYYGIAFYQKSSQSKNLEQAQKFQELEKTIALEEPGVKEINIFGAKLKTVNQVFAQHLYWTNFFKFLEDNTIKNVYYTDFVGDTGGSYSLNALADSYSDIDEQVKALKNNKDITYVEASGGEMVGGDVKGTTLVKFILKFTISKKIFTE